MSTAPSIPAPVADRSEQPFGSQDPVVPRRATRRTRTPDADETGHHSWWLTGLMIFLSLSILVPMYLVVVTALKTPDQLTGAGFQLPNPARWANFGDAWRLTDFPRAALNSAIITV